VYDPFSEQPAGRAWPAESCRHREQRARGSALITPYIGTCSE